jgi:hypothetical protein
MQRAKMRAVSRHQKRKDAIAQLLELGMTASSDGGRERHPLKTVRLKSGVRADDQDIEAAIRAGRD